MIYDVSAYFDINISTSNLIIYCQFATGMLENEYYLIISIFLLSNYVYQYFKKRLNILLYLYSQSFHVFAFEIYINCEIISFISIMHDR